MAQMAQAANPFGAVAFTRLPNHVFNYEHAGPRSSRLEPSVFSTEQERDRKKRIQSTDDFVLRTDRSMARERAASAMSLQQSLQHHPPYQPQPQHEDQQRQERPTRGRQGQQGQTHLPKRQQQQQQQQQLTHGQLGQQSATMSQSPPDADLVDSFPKPQQARRLSTESYVSAASQSSMSNMSGPSSTRGSIDSHGRVSSWSSRSSAAAATPTSPTNSSAAPSSTNSIRASMPPIMPTYNLPRTSTPRTSMPPPPRARPQSAASAAQLQLQRPAQVTPRRKRAAPGELFAMLPGEVLQLILDQLRQMHVGRGSQSCATCWMRDACALSVTTRKMLKYARAALYEDIQLVGADAAHQRKRLRQISCSTRMVLLRRTLRSNPQTAAAVRSFKPPKMPAGADVEQYQSLVASVVMACPNLERVIGCYPAYDPTTFSRFHNALSTRQHLNAVTWIVDTLSMSEEREEKQSSRAVLPHSRARSRSKSSSGNHRASLAHIIRSGSPDRPHHHQSKEKSQARSSPPGQPVWQPQHAASFLELHANWAHLTTMVVHCRPGASLGANDLLATTLSRLPALQKLYLSHLPAASFDDSSLLSLPPLKSLSLNSLPGISSDGLSSFATASANRSLQSLALSHTGLDSLTALARILSKLTNLVSFSFVQSHAPTLSPGEAIWLFPYLASASLRRLHWDVPAYADRANAADMALSRSIAADGFPNLSWLRAPADPEGLFQALCRPLERADLPSDRYRVGRVVAAAAAAPVSHTQQQERDTSIVQRRRRSSSPAGSSSRSHSRSSSNGKPSQKRSHVPSLADRPQLRSHSNLHEARMEAQARLKAARDTPRFQVNVLDDDGVVETFGLAGFIGTVGSNINYHLLPDAGSSDEKGGLVGIEELLADGGETINEPKSSGREETVRGPDGCTGRWNANLDMPQKKDRDRWWHTTRGRWHGVELV